MTTIKIPCTVTRANLHVAYHPRHLELNVDDGDPVYLDSAAAARLQRVLRTFHRTVKQNGPTLGT